jgi:hypothetical protein
MMKIRPFIFCILSISLASLILFLLLAFLQPKTVEAQTSLPIQNLKLSQDTGDPLKVAPDPPQANEPTEIRIVLFNDSDNPITLYAQFYWGTFGLGMERVPITVRQGFILPPHGEGSTAVMWVPPEIKNNSFYADIFDSIEASNPIASFQHNTTYRGHPSPEIPIYTEAVFFPVRNYLPEPATAILSVTVPISATNWEARVEPQHAMLGPGQVIAAQAVFTYTGGGGFPPSGMESFLLSGLLNDQPLREAQVVFGPPMRLHVHPDPPYAESEISVNPYPISTGEPVEICVEVRNVTPQPREGLVTFRVAPFGIALPSEPVADVSMFIPQLGIQRPCTHWVAPDGGQFTFDVRVQIAGFPLLIESQRVIDVSEQLLPNTTSILHFPVHNPFGQPLTIDLLLKPHLPNWEMDLEPSVLPNMQPFETRPVTLTIRIPPDSPMPPDESPVVDVEAYVGTELIGGFRKIYRPPVPIHRPTDPIYAESEITINPYPPREREPTEICVELRNPTSITQTLTVDFNVAQFGIGLPFHVIARPIPVTISANSMQRVCITWVPPFGGRFGVEVGIQMEGHERVYSQRVIDVGEILLPNQPSSFDFEVGNPYTFPISVTLGVIRYMPQWEVAFNPHAFFLQPGAIQTVEMVVNPVQNLGDPEPHEGDPVLDVEAYWEGNNENGLLGGFRKLFFPPIPVHRPENPPYAEEEINIWPYPPLAGEPTHLEFVVRNPTTATQQIIVTFEWSNLGIGLPFTTIDGPQHILLQPQQAGGVGIVWVPPFGGEFCVRVKVEASYFREPFYSARNISIVRLPEPYGEPEVFQFVVSDNGNTTRPLTITLGLRDYLPNWQVALLKNQIVLEPGATIATDVLTITPPSNPADLPIDGGPIVDISAYVSGELIGGIRKVWRPPVPLGNPQEPSYAESEIMISPDPPVVGQPATFGAQLRNNTDYSQTITIQYSWADFGVGIPFTNTNVTPATTTITLGPHITTTVSAEWTPLFSGNICVQIILINEETGDELHSQRNVYAIELPEVPCEPFIKDFLLQNTSSEIITVTIGASSLNLPPGWTYSVDPAEVVLASYEGITVTVTITPLCELSTSEGMFALVDEGKLSPAKLRVEGYDQDRVLVGGVEIQLISAVQHPIYLPIVLRNSGMKVGGNASSETISPNGGLLPKSWIEQSFGVLLLLLVGAGIHWKRLDN